MKVGALQRAVGQLAVAPLVVAVGVGFVPVSEPGLRAGLLALGLLGAVASAALFGMVVALASRTAIPSSLSYLYGALVGYQHGSVGMGTTLLRSVGLLAPMGVWALTLALSMTGSLR